MKSKSKESKESKEKSRKRTKPIEEAEFSEIVDDQPKSKKKKTAIAEHKQTLEELQKKDPKFFEFLKQQDAELLDFDESDAEVEEEDDEDGDRESKEDDGQGPSDDEEEVEEPFSDDEEQRDEISDEEDEASSKVPITPKLIRQWQKELEKFAEIKTKMDQRKVGDLLGQIVDAFRAVVAQTGARPEKRGQYRIDDSAGFNGVVRLCFSAFPAIWQKLGLSDGISDSQGRQKRLRPYVKPYLHNLIEFLQEIHNADVLNAVLKHLTHVAEHYCLFGTLPQKLIKVLVNVWSTKDESARVLAFVSIMKLVRAMPDTLATIAMKKMYLAYVQNTKLVTPSSWPLISFMQKSYAELCGVNKQLSYQHSFIYIRQMAIHLRNAITTKKKEAIMAVHNWQFVQCLYLWARVLSVHAENETLKPLAYPLIQVALGCARLIPTSKFLPLRFHCVRAILILAQETGVYVPVLPIVLEAFQLVDSKKKHQRQSLKPLDFDCLIKLSQSQLQESAFKTGVLEATLELIVETMNAYSNSLAFPELAVICCTRLKAFQRECYIAALARPVKELSDKIMEHALWLENRRSAAAIKLTNDDGSADAFEAASSEADDSPMKTYFQRFKTMKERERKLKLETAEDNQNGNAALDDDDDDEKPLSKKKQKQQQTQRPSKPNPKKEIANPRKKQTKSPRSPYVKENGVVNGEEDVVQDLNLSDLD